ncbi:hypothetical protein GE09DRAFT_363912 [Coniochaeta sp. 2T2.1]|nr:hypothetical protein GE09DRAFT_363912 [Coniochaeta sp. 2T2.1]
MPEVPQNMQEDLQRMELEGNPRRGTNDPYAHNREGSFQSYQQDKQQPPPLPPGKPLTAGSFSDMDAPSFSPFPKVKGENIPPSDDEKEDILYHARPHVLHSNNVPMQIAWARDVLMWAEVQAEAHAREWKRENKGRDRERPPTPKAEHDLRVDAVNIIEYLASQNHPEATFMKAKWQEFGKFGQRENKRDAYLGYKEAAKMGWGRAEYRIGMLYENSNDIEKAIKHYNQGAALKDSAANYRLGMLYILGQHGYHEDYQKGLDMIQIAADAADEDAPQGAYVYGMLIARELPDVTIPEFILPAELGVARQYIEKAAYLGFAKAQLKMGQAYELSQLACDFNPAYSLHYYGLAARQGQPEAALGVSRWFLFGYEGVFQKNEQLAFKYGEQAGEAGLPTGEFAMGYYYEIGIHVSKDIRQARTWYERASEHGNKDAKERLQGLNNSQTLTKNDHETTTLTRIKSQHGSQRGKRPERFTRPNDTMPTLAEGEGDEEPRPPVPMKKESPRVSPERRAPTIVAHDVEFPDPERQSTMTRPPAFTVKLDAGQPLTMRPKSVAPYPEDDRPPPLNLSRPKSTAPYPDDDVGSNKPALSPHFNPGIRPSSSAGPQADRPMSAFGIRPLSGAPPQNLQQNPDPRGRASAGPNLTASWEPQVPAGYRQPSPNAKPAPYPPRQSSAQPAPASYAPLPSQRMGASSVGPGVVPAGTTPPTIGDLRNRLQKPVPALDKPTPTPPTNQSPYPSSQPNLLPATTQPAQPGRDYGPRASSRPVNDTYDRYGAVPPAGYSVQSPTNHGPSGQPQGHNRLPSAGSGPASSRPQPQHHQTSAPAVRPGLLDIGQPGGPGGRSSAPPASNQQPGRPSPGGPSMVQSNASAASLPGTQFSSKPQGGKPQPGGGGGKTGTGPATFEEMGIPQGKNESDCVVM